MKKDYFSGIKTVSVLSLFMSLAIAKPAFAENMNDTDGKGKSKNAAFFNDYTTIQVASGFNADIIANGIGPLSESVTNDADGFGYSFISQGLQINEGDTPITFGLPENGQINNATAGPGYQLAPYSGNNALRLSAISEEGTVTFTNALSLQTLYLLVTSANISEISGTINFTDGTTQSIATAAIPDWFSQAGLPLVATAIGRGLISTNQLDNFGNAPNLFQLGVMIESENQSKLIESVTIHKENDETVFNLLAVSGAVVSIPPDNMAMLQVASGFNADIIANGTGPLSESVTNDADGFGYSFIAKGLQINEGDTPITFGLPENGQINNASAGPDYQLAPYSGNNALRLSAISEEGTVTFTNTLSLETLYLLVTSANISEISGTINFTDGTTQSIANSNIPDWFSQTGLPLVATGIGRGLISTNQLDNFGNAPNLFQLEVMIDSENQSKMIESVTIQKENDETVFNLLAVSGIEASLGIDKNSLVKLTLYPNPVTDFLHIQTNDEIEQVIIYDMAGKIIRTETATTGTVNFEDIAQGVYFIKVFTENKSSKTLKVIKQ